MLEISMYVGALGHHAPLAWWGFLISALTALCNHPGSAAAMSKERGDRRRLLHYQIVLRIITVEMHKESLRKFIKQKLNILPNGNVRLRARAQAAGVPVAHVAPTCPRPTRPWRSRGCLSPQGVCPCCENSDWCQLRLVRPPVRDS